MIRAERLSREARMGELDTMNMQITEKERQIGLLMSLVASQKNCIQLVYTQLNVLESYERYREVEPFSREESSARYGSQGTASEGTIHNSSGSEDEEREPRRR